MTIKAPLSGAECGVLVTEIHKSCPLAAHSWEEASLNSAVSKHLAGGASVSLPCPKAQECICSLKEGSRIELSISVRGLKTAFSVSFPTILKL